MSTKTKVLVVISLILAIALPVFANGNGETTTAASELSPVQEIIRQAEGMSMEELAKKAIEESNGAMFYGVGNSSRGKTALPLFIAYLQTIDPSYTLNYEWQQPKNNKIFDQLTADSLKETGTFAMTLIQDGNQIEATRLKARWSEPASSIPSFPKNGQKPTELRQMNIQDIFRCRLSTRYSCTTTPAASHTTTYGIS